MQEARNKGDFTSEKEQKLLESEAEVSNTEDTNADELTFEEISGFSDDYDNSDEETVCAFCFTASTYACCAFASAFFAVLKEF